MKNILELKDFSVSLKSNNHKILNDINIEIKEKEFFESYFSLFLQFALKYIPDEETCKDIVQEAFIKYWRQENNFNDEIALKTYLYKSIRNGCLNQLRHENVF